MYSIEDLKRDRTTLWTDVRNYLARNNLRAMRVGDLVLYYHSAVAPIGVVGVAKVVGEAEADPTQFDQQSEYFDPKATRDLPRWFSPRLAFVQVLPRMVQLEAIKKTRGLHEMALLHSSRLSVQPVREKEFEIILKMSEK